MDTAPVSPLVRSRPFWVNALGTLVAVVVVLAILYFGYQYFGTKELAKKLPTEGTSISFTEEGLAKRFAVSGISFVAEPPFMSGGMTILESQPHPTIPGDRVVLASKTGTSGVVVGVLKADGAFETILEDETNKIDLAVTKNGFAVFSVPNRLISFTEDADVTASSESDEEDAVEEKGSANGPVDLGFDTAVTEPATGLFALDLNSGGEGVARSLGTGKNPRVRADGSLVALSSEGVVRIDPVTGTRITVLAHQYGDAVGSGLSTDGTLVAFRRDGDSVIDVYSLSTKGGVPAGSIFSSAPVYGISIIDDQHIFVRNGKYQIALYRLSDTNKVEPPTAHLLLLSNQ